MAGIANASGVTPGSEVIRTTDFWNLPLDSKEQQLIVDYPKLENAVELLQKILVQLNQPLNSLNAQILISQLRKFKKFWGKLLVEGDTEVKKFCGDFVARRGLAALVRSYIADCYREAGRPSIMDDVGECSLPWWPHIKDVSTRLRCVVSWWTDSSDDMCRNVGESKLLNDLLFEIRHVTVKVRKTEDVSHYEASDFHSTIVILFNCSKCHDCIPCFVKSDALSILRPVRHSKPAELKWVVLTTMCNIARNNDSLKSDWVADSVSLWWAVKMLKKGRRGHEIALEAGNTRQVSFKGSELLEGLESVTSRPENRRMSVMCGLLAFLPQLFADDHAEDKAKILACKTLVNLCGTDEIRNEVSETDCEKNLQQLVASEGCCQSVKDAANEALDVLIG